MKSPTILQRVVLLLGAVAVVFVLKDAPLEHWTLPRLGALTVDGEILMAQVAGVMFITGALFIVVAPRKKEVE